MKAGAKVRFFFVNRKEKTEKSSNFEVFLYFCRRFMKKEQFFSRTSLRFRRFSRKGYALFSVLGREVLIGVLSVAVVSHAMAEGVSVDTELAKDTVVREAQTLDDVVVLGSRAPLTEGETARMVTVITSDDIQRAPVTTVNDVLKMVTGVDVRQRGGFGVQTDISIDGGTFDQIAILLNGVNIGNPQTGHLSADFPVSLEDIERIEIIEGAAARVFGASAFNGAVNIVTKKGQRSKAKGLKTKVEGVVALEGGSYGTFGGNGRVAGKKMSLSAGYRQSDGGTENSYFRQSQGFYSLNSSLSALNFHLTLGATGKRYGANTFYSAAYPDQYESNGRFFASADVIGKLSDSFQFQVQPYWNLNTDHFQLIRGSGVGENFHLTNVVGGKINGYFDWLLGKTSCGVEIRSESIRRTFHSDRTEYSLFLEHNIIYKRCTISMGVVANSNTGYDSRFHFFPGIDAKYRVWKTAKADCDIFISYNTAFRMPTFTDLFYKSPTNEGNKDLKPERVQSLRVGGKYNSSLFTLHSSLFYDWGTDMIDWVMYSPQDIWHSANFRLDNRGATVNCQLSIINSQLSKLSVQAGYCFVDQKRYDDVSIYRSNYAMEYLKHKVTLSPRLSILHSKLFTLHFLVSYRWQDRQGPLYKPFSLIDAKVTLEHKKYEATLSLNNITSYRYYDLSTGPQPGFWCMAGIKVKFP